MSWYSKRRRDPEIAPDEIFLDAANTAGFDRGRFEGRIERPLARSTYTFLGGTLGLLFLVLLAQAWNLEVRQGSEFALKSERNSLESTTLFAERGIITDRNGVPLVTNVAGSSTFARRVYKTPGFSSLLGYVSYPKKDSSGNYYDTEMKGVAGVENSFNSLLSGQNGTLLVEQDVFGKLISQGTVVRPQNGASLTLSIDSRAQSAFYSAISGLAEKASYVGGAGVLMSVETGEIYALVSYPEYDSNVLSDGAPSSVIAGYATNPRRVYLNRPVQGLYTPGSVVKPLEAAGALADGTVTADYTVNATGSLSLPNPYNPSKPTIFPDWRVFGMTDLRKAIAWSSDVYFYIVGGGYQGKEGLGIDRLKYWYDTFGLTSLTGIELPGENSGFVPTPSWKERVFGESWNVGNTYHTAIGQYAMQVTLLEMARATAAVANGGKLLNTTLVANPTPVYTSLPIPAVDFRIVREGMREGVTYGTSHGLADLSFVTLAGKTGTAQTGVRNEFHNTWAVGFWPYERPKYVYVVMMERGPSTNLLGGIYAMHQILSELHKTAPEYFE